jgi:hypothetical protein
VFQNLHILFSRKNRRKFQEKTKKVSVFVPDTSDGVLVTLEGQDIGTIYLPCTALISRVNGKDLSMIVLSTNAGHRDWAITNSELGTVKIQTDE